jgi:cell division protein FtsI/penicillin-binding protein 2
VLVYFGILLRLVQLRFCPDPRLVALDDSHVGTRSVTAPRGDIFDRNGRLLATDLIIRSLAVDPGIVTDPLLLAATLRPILGMDKNENMVCLAKLDKQGKQRQFVPVKRGLSDEEVGALSSLNKSVKKGVIIQTESRRFYPEGELAAQVLGYMGPDKALSEGIERSYDSYLRSIPGKLETRVDANRTVLTSRTIEYEPPRGGDDLHLTLDAPLQNTLEHELDAALEANDAAWAMGMLIDPKTGAVLALASRPAFNPNEYGRYKPELRKNRAVLDVFEPGSVFKIVAASAALEEGMITPQTLIDCEGGVFRHYGRRIGDFHKLGVEPFSTCFAESSNIAIIKVAELLGPKSLFEWVHRFGFGQRSTPDFAKESPGIVHPLSEWTRFSMGSVPMGQEISVTLPQLARAFSVIANGGCLVEPYLVERAVAPDGTTTYEHELRPPRRVLSEATAATMRELCHLVVTQGTGTAACIREFRVGGKTGTAQIARPDGKGFFSDRFTTIFAGFAPLSDPKICAVIVVQEPQVELHYGGHVCGPIFKRVVREALIRMNCPEDPIREDIKESAPEVADADMVVARADRSQEMLEPLNGLDLVSYGADVTYDEPCLPSFVGMTKRQVLLKSKALGVQWVMEGAGRLVSQEPPAGTLLSKVTLCRLRFSGSGGVNDDETEPVVARSAM